MGPIRCPETSVYNYHTTPRNIPEERRSQDVKNTIILGAFGNLGKATISFVPSVRPSVRPHGTTRLSLEGFLWNCTLFRLLNYIQKIQVCLNRTKITHTLHVGLRTFMTSSVTIFTMVAVDSNRFSILMIVICLISSCGLTQEK